MIFRFVFNASFGVFPAARVVKSHLGYEVQARLGYGLIVFYWAMFAFFTIGALVSHSPLLLLLAAATGLSIAVIVRRERAWVPKAAASATKLLKDR